MLTASRRDVLRFRVAQHQLDRPPGSADDVDLLDLGVQDTGHDGAAWALAIRGARTTPDLAFAWTLRGAPHAYRRRDLAAVAVATTPYDEADAAKRVFDASRPLKAAGIPVLDALRTIADHLADIATTPVAKGAASTQLTARLDRPYLRDCRPCQATHAYENPFRMAALQAGLELEPGTSPPVLTTIDGHVPNRYVHLAGEAEPRFDVVRDHLRFYGPCRPQDVAASLDAPVQVVKARWPVDVVEVRVDGGPPRSLLAEDADRLAGASATREVRLLGPYDPYLQLRDRELLVADEARRKDLWRVLGRPGAVLVDGEVAGTWRPRASGKRLDLAVEPWRELDAAERRSLSGEAERLATSRGASLGAVAVA